MSDLRALEALQALHGELVAVRQHRFEGLQTLEQLLEAQTEAFKHVPTSSRIREQERSSPKFLMS